MAHDIYRYTHAQTRPPSKAQTINDRTIGLVLGLFKIKLSFTKTRPHYNLTCSRLVDYSNRMNQVPKIKAYQL